MAIGQLGLFVPVVKGILCLLQAFLTGGGGIYQLVIGQRGDNVIGHNKAVPAKLAQNVLWSNAAQPRSVLFKVVQQFCLPV